jgi:hypothetical protein
MQYTDAIQEPDVFCYQLAYWMTYDPESVWQLVQRHNGYMSVLPAGYYEFYIDRDYASILVLAFPQLRRQYQKDLYT